jgi:diguanylate cyclase (GGDEF)-like protein
MPRSPDPELPRSVIDEEMVERVRMSASTGDAVPRRSLSNRVLGQHTWAFLGALLVVTGTVGSTIAASTDAHFGAERSRAAFVASSADMAAVLGLALQHEQDLVVDAEAFVLGQPYPVESGFLSWAATVSALARYPELQGFGEAVIVPQSRLKAYEAYATTVSNNGFPPQKPFVVTPPGHRPFYCFSVIGLDRNVLGALPAGFDLCGGARGPALLATRGSGQVNLEPLKVGAVTTVLLGVPVYRGGTTARTFAARQAAFVGWVGMDLAPDVVLRATLHGHPHMAVELRYGTGASLVTFEDGTAPKGAESSTANLNNGWSIQTFGTVRGSSLFGDPSALVLLIAGMALSLVLGALMYVLGTGRARATLLVGERTEELQFQALHDSLTKLPNRALILDRTELMLARARRSHLPAVAMFLDLDDFQDINDTLGHHVGDQLLVAVGSRLVAALREGDTVGRLGGDEFILLVEGATLHAGLEVAADRILAVLGAPFKIAGHDALSISASIGVASGDRVTADELLRDADVALYRAKASGKKRAVVFAPSMQVAAQDRHALAADLRDALPGAEFFLLYQPTIDLQTNAFTGVEALLRWRHPDRGVVQPDDFIPALETSGLIVPVGAWVLQEACRQGAAWRSRGHRFTVSVNVSARQLELDRFVRDVEAALSVTGFEPGMLVLELTETTLMNDLPETLARLGDLKALGVRLAIDDFGTGYSSLAYLRKFPIDILKIDRSFVSGIGDSAASAALVHTLVQLGKVLNLETIAEGIEDDDQRLRLQAEEVDTGQGFFFSRPLDVLAVDRFLQDFIVDSGATVRGDARAGQLSVNAEGSRS